MKIYATKFAPTLMIVGVLSGCAVSPDLGDSISARGEAFKQTGKDYARGQKLVSDGEKNIKNGGNQVTKGEDQIRIGEKLIKDATREFCSNVQYSDPACR